MEAVGRVVAVEGEAVAPDNVLRDNKVVVRIILEPRPSARERRETAGGGDDGAK
jgi:hypothetical protein